ALAQIVRSVPLDFVQVNYSVEEPEAARELLPLAQERGVAVLVNRPFGGGGLLRRLRNRPVSDWAAELGCESWAQLLLTYVIGHPAVTCVIPATSQPDHLRQNLVAGAGEPPDAAMLEKIAEAAR
ncbi:MAG: aldo/keto reductase, partial [Chloroflexota bacterium]